MKSRGHLREHSELLLWLMRVTDVAVSLGFCALGYAIVFGPSSGPPNVLYYQIAVLFSILLQLVGFHAFDLYRTWRGEDYMQEFVSLLLAWTTIFAVLIILSVITKTSASFSRAWLLIWYFGGAGGLICLRFSLRSVLRRMRAKGYNLRHVVILASGDVGERVLDQLRASPEAGFNVAGYFASSPTTQAPDKAQQGDIASGLQYVRSHHVDQIWLAMPFKEEELIKEVMEQLRDATADVRLIPDLFGFRLINHSISTVANISVINLSVTPMDGVNRWIKAIEDKVISSLLLLVLSPLLLFIALAVKISSPGPVLYHQERVSWNNRRFNMYKFRTMPVNVEADSGPVWASSGEQRATVIGGFLRKTSLDELPQFWNVLKGDMSIVGPRPERPVFVEQFKDEVPRYMQKHMVKAGITGWAQINGWRGNTDLEKRIEHDLYYIDNWSLWLDLKIILMTAFKGFVHKNAY
ncbi:undecaprenyl-phosphate glucose phosphotransferase [Halioglobus maricola]|uniref:Undecaprenyl-phosphate glucose phosphotransferase n=1 Tax=Halioglobus maricola TaxID=2601894 RepID=A0A5P9NFA3_9GAMM|nr:undecaprenyl-phosphate glucose phosphotransferase [Halioglobus maricola]QFU74467.1 undecaprenyl-phosphate glucose phosphotransferase [Halioglobus maricola]